jgi:hypothetical protein
MPLQYSHRFVLEYELLPSAIQQKVKKALRLLAADFRQGLCSHPVQGAPGVFEAYVDHKYRMTFERHSAVFIMRNVDNHDECLKNP